MKRIWLLLDCSFLVFRAQYAMKEEGNAIFGFIATMLSLRERFDTDNIVFCFDRAKLKRTDLLPTYKEQRREPIHEEEHRKAKECMTILRRSTLIEMGFNNILSQAGYEADDIIASVVHNSLGDDDAVIVSSDNDMNQLLSPRVVIHNPNKEGVITEKSFIRTWNILPEDWAMVKAISGCRSDNVEGVKGVGDKTAAKFLAGQLEWHTAGYQKVKQAPRELIERNLKLVRLPFAGTKTFKLNAEEKIDWERVRMWGASKKDVV